MWLDWLRSYTRQIKGTETNSISSHISERRYTDNGVGTYVSTVHHMDSATISEPLSDSNILNVFDAMIGSIADIGNLSLKINESYFDRNNESLKLKLRIIESSSI